MKRLAVIGILAAATSLQVLAVPTLQLDIDNGTYVGGSEDSTMTSRDVFKLQALMTDGNIGRTYYISIALTPMTPRPGGSFGSIVFNGQTIDVTADMVYGTPPLDSMVQNLPGHDIYPTYYKEIAFKFDANQIVQTYNVEDGVIMANQTSYIRNFDVDISGLDRSKEVHFDLYTFYVNRNKRVVRDFAPLSHDAGTARNVPDAGSTFALFGLAIATLGFVRRRMSR